MKKLFLILMVMVLSINLYSVEYKSMIKDFKLGDKRETVKKKAIEKKFFLYPETDSTIGGSGYFLKNKNDMFEFLFKGDTLVQIFVLVEFDDTKKDYEIKKKRFDGYFKSYGSAHGLPNETGKRTYFWECEKNTEKIRIMIVSEPPRFIENICYEWLVN